MFFTSFTCQHFMKTRFKQTQRTVHFDDYKTYAAMIIHNQQGQNYVQFKTKFSRNIIQYA